MKQDQKAFTLIELLVVISIIALLTSIITSSLSASRQKARDAAKISALHQARSALQLYYTDNGYYPESLDALTSSGKYISSVIPEASYTPTTLKGGSCSGNTCETYALTITLERTDNPATRFSSSLEKAIKYCNTATSTIVGYGSDSSAVNKCYVIVP